MGLCSVGAFVPAGPIAGFAGQKTCGRSARKSVRRRLRRCPPELYHEPFCWITNVFTFPGLPALLILVLVRLAATVPAFRLNRIEPGHGSGLERQPIAFALSGVSAMGVEHFSMDRSDVRSDPSRIHPDGSNPFCAGGRRAGCVASG